eukprot:g31256.t1
MREGIVCLNWIRGLFLIVKVVEDRHRGIVTIGHADVIHMPALCAPLTYRPKERDGPKLPSLDTPLSAREARKTGAARPKDAEEVKTEGSELDSGYPALELHGERLGKGVPFHPDGQEQEGFESKLLACEARFRKIERLTARVTLPDTAVTAVVVDLLRDVVDTLPAPVRKVAAGILRHVENAIYSDERLPEKCSEVDRQASVLANRITEVEMENQEQQRILEESLAAGAELKEKCMVEQQELSRLKQIWSDTQPELLLQVLAQSLELFFSLVVHQANLHHLEVKHRLAKKDVRPLLEDPGSVDEPTEAILLRWMNRTLAKARKHCEELLDDPAKVESQDALILIAQQEDLSNLDDDLSDCVALTALYAMIKAEREEKSFSQKDWTCLKVDRELRSVQLCYCFLEISPTERAKCLLVPHEVAAGDTEKLLTFLAAVFAFHPMLQDLPFNMNNMQAMALQNVLRDALATISVEQILLRWINAQLALDSAQPRPVENFGSDLQDIFRQPKTMLDAKELREFLFYTSVSIERLTANNKEVNVDQAGIGKVEDILKRHFRLLRAIFKHYSTAKPSGAHGVDLKGLLKLFQECKLRSKEFAPFHLETIFNHHLEDKTRTGDDKLLAPHEFIEVLILCAFTKFRAAGNSLAEQVRLLIDDHLKPNACNDSESMFQQMAYSSQVRQVLDQHSKELFYIFQLYACLDMSTTEAMQKENTMNITEFQMMLDDCGFLDLTLTEQAVQQIFQGIQQNATADDEEENEGVDDDEEMSLSEFLDGLVAVAAYKFPDPFTPLSTRINTFMLQLFAALRKHWSRKRGAPRVDMMLNALQKKMR